MERHDENALIVYTDGSMLSSPRRGGYAYRLIHVDDTGNESDPVDSDDPGYLNATSNQMELLACVEALKLVTGRRPPWRPESYGKIVVYTDSTYVQDHIYQAEHVWPKRGWLTRENEPVLNPDLWKDLVRLVRKAGRVDFRKVKGHGSNPHNRVVDRLAKESARSAIREMPSPPIVGRKQSERRVDAGVVPMRGQTETIRIIVVRTMRRQPYHSYRYEVVDRDSPNHGAVDDAFARDGEIAMRRAHIYEVRFAEEGSGRWITQIVREIDRS